MMWKFLRICVMQTEWKKKSETGIMLNNGREIIMIYSTGLDHSAKRNENVSVL